MWLAGIAVGLTVAGSWAPVWTNRAAIWKWLDQRSRGQAGAGLHRGTDPGHGDRDVGYKVNHYMEHDNDFCVVAMSSSPTASRSSARTPAPTSSSTSSRESTTPSSAMTATCRTRSAQAQELILWMVDRPDKVPEHAKVPPTVCKSCHESGEAKESWQEIVTTAGHRVHFESDSLEAEEVECLTCHARSAHRFEPVDSTCSQQGCHLTDDVTIKLGKMTDAVGLHCAVCHEFTADVPKLATFDSASGTLVPGDGQCFSCHEMQERLKDFDPRRDPHDGKCGMCHNPHTNVEPDGRPESLRDGRHATATGEQVEFHTGQMHREGDRELRNLPPAARRARGRQCLRRLPRTGARIGHRKGGSESLHCPSTPPRRSARVRRGQTRSALMERATRRRMRTLRRRWSLRPRRTASSMPQHKDLACLTCHATSSATSTLNFAAPARLPALPPLDRRPSATAPPATSPRRLVAETDRVTVTVPGARPSPSGCELRACPHTELACKECHTTPVSLAARRRGQGLRLLPRAAPHGGERLCRLPRRRGHRGAAHTARPWPMRGAMPATHRRGSPS